MLELFEAVLICALVLFILHFVADRAQLRNARQMQVLSNDPAQPPAAVSPAADEAGRAAAMVNALDSALQASKFDFFGPGKETGKRAHNNAELQLKRAQDVLGKGEALQAQELARMGTELLKVAYMSSNGPGPQRP